MRLAFMVTNKVHIIPPICLEDNPIHAPLFIDAAYPSPFKRQNNMSSQDIMKICGRNRSRRRKVSILCVSIVEF